MELASTPKDEIARFGTAVLYRFRGQESGDSKEAPLLLVPSMINRWFVLDLRSGSSLAEALVRAAPSRPTYVLDWGVAEDEDRYLTWDDVLARLGRAAKRVLKDARAEKLALLGYCMGGTLAAIHAALHPETVAALVNLAGPIDFSHAGLLGEMVDARWFDARAIANAGNVSAEQMQSGFTAMRPTLTIGKWIGFMDRAHDPAARDSFRALEAWAGDNIPFPGAAYATYIGDLYQKNSLVRAEHRVAGARVDLSKITAPILTITAERDTICPPAAAKALADHSRAKVRDVLEVPGGHVGAVIGSKASKFLYPGIAAWLAKNAGVRADESAPRAQKELS